MAENRVIGNAGRLPWRLPGEMAHFRRVTMGHPVIMGRRTFASMKRPLSGRTNIVLSKSGIDVPPGVHVVADFDAALDIARAQCLHDRVDAVMIVGGAAVYAFALPRAQVLYMTIVHASPEGDTFFPPFDLGSFVEVSQERHAPDHDNSIGYTIHELRRPPAEC